MTGQDGSYLTEPCWLMAICSRLSTSQQQHDAIENRSLKGGESIYGQKLFLYHGDLDDTTTIRRLLAKTIPDGVYLVT